MAGQAATWSRIGMHFGAASNALSYGAIIPTEFSESQTTMTVNGYIQGSLDNPGFDNVLMFTFKPQTSPVVAGLSVSATMPGGAYLQWQKTLGLLGICLICESGLKSNSQIPITYKLNGVLNTSAPTAGPVVIPVAVDVAVYSCNYDFLGLNLLGVLNLLSTGNCKSTPIYTGTITTTFTVSLDKYCTLSGSDLNFGQLGANLATATATTTTTSRCTNTTPYNITVSAGNSGDPNNRYMVNTAKPSERLYYQLYKDAAFTVPMGSGSAISGTGTGMDQSTELRAKITSSELVPAGTYADKLTVTMEY